MLVLFVDDDDDDEDGRPSRRRRLAERAAEGTEEEEVRILYEDCYPTIQFPMLERSSPVIFAFMF